MSLHRVGGRGFTTSTALLRAKTAKSTPEISKTSRSITARPPEVKLIKGLGSLSTFTCPDFVKKIRKLNPEVRFDKPMADGALERSLALKTPPSVMKAIRKATHDRSHHVKSQRLHRGKRELLRNWKRLLEESEEYWNQ